MTRNHYHCNDALSSGKRFKTCDNADEGPWSDLNRHLLYLVMLRLGVGDYLSFGGACKSWRSLALCNRNAFMASKPPMPMLNHHVLFLIMMQLGVVDYPSFGGVCKSWRSLALSNRNLFMVSKPPMTMRIYWRSSQIKDCYLEDFEGRNFSTFLPFAGGTFVGLTSGYLIFLKRKSRKFLLLNPITRHELIFNDFPINYASIIKDLHWGRQHVRGILVYSLSIRRWVFLAIHNSSNQIWFSTAGTGAWNHVSCTSFFTDLRAFKGKIYTLNRNPHSYLCELYELRLNPEPKLMLLETKNSLQPSQISELVSSREHIYVMDRIPPNKSVYMRARTPIYQYRFQELDFGKMRWVSHEKTVGEYASFLSDLKHGVAVNPELCESGRQSLLLGHNDGDLLKLIEVEKPESPLSANMWYFPHECLNDDPID